MFGPFRRFPFRGLALVALGFLLASVLAGGGSAFSGAATGFGLVLLLPLFLFKMMFMFFLFGALLRFAGGGPRMAGGGWGPGHWHHRSGYRSSEGERQPYEPDQQEWEESLRQAREDLREYDTPFSTPPPGFQPQEPSEDPKGPEGSEK